METQTSAGNTDNTSTATPNLLATAVTNTTSHVEATSTENIPASKFTDLLGEDGKFVTDWSSKLPEGFKEHAKTLAKFKDPNALITSYVSLEKEFSKKNIPIKMPGEEATEQDWVTYKQSIGAPDKKEAYGIVKPEAMPEAQWNTALADKASDVALKYGIPVKAMHELIDVYNGNMGDLRLQGEKIQQKQYEETINSVKKEWGTEYNSNLQRANRAAKAIGLDTNDPVIGNNLHIIKALLNVDGLIAEDKGIAKSSSTAQTYKESYDKLVRGDDYNGKNGLERQQEAAEKIKQLFHAMRS
jgi:hypothetical protein